MVCNCFVSNRSPPSGAVKKEVMMCGNELRVLGFGAALLLPAACSSGPLALPDSQTPLGMEFQVADTLFGPGDTIRVNLSNNTEYELGYNLCFADLERRVDGSWLVVQRYPQGTACITPLYILPPGESTFGLQIVYPFLDSGVYRLRDQVEWPIREGRVDVISNGFSIAQE